MDWVTQAGMPEYFMDDIAIKREAYGGGFPDRALPSLMSLILQC